MVTRRKAKQAQRADKAARSAAKPRRSRSRRGGGSDAARMLVWGIVGLVALGLVAVLGGAVDLDGGMDAPDSPTSPDADESSWSYYHDREYSSNSVDNRWQTRTDSRSDPDDAPLGDSNRWVYEGPYRYGGYGNDGMRRRAKGEAGARDPLYSDLGSDALPDVFETYSDQDPSGGMPVGQAPSSWTSPYYDPHAGYSNPYANRIRMGYGEGFGPGAAALDG